VTISTAGLDDDQVEVLETIIFTFGEITNGTTETTDVTLNLESEDQPNSSLSATNPDMNEGESTSITLELDSPTAQDVVVPLIITGTATFDIDYSTDFATEGQEEIVMSVENYDYFDVLDDGRLLFTDGGGLHLYNPTDQSYQQYYLDYYWNEFHISGQYVYLKRNTQIAKFNIDQFDVTDGSNQITPEIVVGSDVLGNNDYFEGSISVEGENLIYQIYDWPNGRNLYKKSGDNEPELMYSGDSYATNLLLFNDRIYSFNGNEMRELYDGQYSNPVYYDNLHFYENTSFNGVVYALIENYSSNNRQVVRLNIETDIINSSGNSVSPIELPYELGDGIDYLRRFAFDSQGNLLLYNEINNSTFGVFSYQFFPEISISAGGTTGTFTFQSIEDNSFEEDETIIITPGDALNATISSDEPLTLTIIDDDNPPMISFELSSESIIENSETSVTLTAISDVASGVEITIPFTLSGTAQSDEYEVSSESIVIAPNATSGSVTISTFGFDDNDVELAESIIFTFGEISNAETETESVTVSLLSDDNSTISSVEVSQTEINEGESVSVVVNLDQPQANDAYLPVTFNGTATFGSDFETQTDSEGEESLIGSVDQYSQYAILNDGRHIFLQQGQIYFYEEDLSSYNVAYVNSQTQEHYKFLVIEEDRIFVGGDQGIVEVDYTDISSNQVSIEDVIELSGGWMRGSFDVDNESIVYVYEINNQSGQNFWLLENFESDPQLLFGQSNFCCYVPKFVNGQIYLIDNWRYRVLDNGNVSAETGYGNNEYYLNSESKIIPYSQGVLALGSSNGGPYEINYYNLQTGQASSFGIESSESIAQIQNFEIDQNNNIVIHAYYQNPPEPASWSLISYNYSTQIKIDAGQTTGSILISTIDDESYEDDETIIVGFGTPKCKY